MRMLSTMIYYLKSIFINIIKNWLLCLVIDKQTNKNCQFKSKKFFSIIKINLWHQKFKKYVNDTFQNDDSLNNVLMIISFI